MTIMWDRRMKPYKSPEEIPNTLVAVDLDVYEYTESKDSAQEQDRRELSAKSEYLGESILINDREYQEIRRMMILDALEVQWVRDQDSEELE